MKTISLKKARRLAMPGEMRVVGPYEGSESAYGLAAETHDGFTEIADGMLQITPPFSPIAGTRTASWYGNLSLPFDGCGKPKS
jgi:hypothetical protein